MAHTTRSTVPSRLTATGHGLPITFSNTRPGPPMASTRSAMPANSRSGSTAAVMRRNCPRASRSARNWRRSCAMEPDPPRYCGRPWMLWWDEGSLLPHAGGGARQWPARRGRGHRRAAGHHHYWLGAVQWRHGGPRLRRSGCVAEGGCGSTPGSTPAGGGTGWSSAGGI